MKAIEIVIKDKIDRLSAIGLMKKLDEEREKSFNYDPLEKQVLKGNKNPKFREAFRKGLEYLRGFKRPFQYGYEQENDKLLIFPVFDSNLPIPVFKSLSIAWEKKVIKQERKKLKKYFSTVTIVDI